MDKLDLDLTADCAYKLSKKNSNPVKDVEETYEMMTDHEKKAVDSIFGMIRSASIQGKYETFVVYKNFEGFEGIYWPSVRRVFELLGYKTHTYYGPTKPTGKFADVFKTCHLPMLDEDSCSISWKDAR